MMTMTIESSVMDITPDVAKELLGRNKNVRKINRHRVVELAGKMRRGAFLTTHQGIAINEDGDLIDGQHRLAAIVMSGVTVNMLVTIIPDTACIGIDCGLVRPAYLLAGISKQESAHARFLLFHVCKNTVSSADLIKDLAKSFSPDIEYLSRFPNLAKTKISPAPVMAALILLAGDRAPKNFDRNLEGFTSGDLASCDNAIVTLWKSIVASRRSSGGYSAQADRFRRTFRAFTRPSTPTIRIANTTGIDDAAAEIFRRKYGDKFFKI